MASFPQTDNTIRACLLFLSFVAATACLYFTRDIVAPFALAIFIWLIIDTFARWLDRLSPKIPYWLALTVAVLCVIFGLVGIILVVADTATDIAREAPNYSARLVKLFGWVGKISWFDTLSWTSLIERFEGQFYSLLQRGLGGFATSIQGVVSSFFIIAIYVAFLFAAQSSFPKKMNDLFPDTENRARAAKIGASIRLSIEKYLGVQTLVSLIQTVLSYIIMAAFGLDNALFWALVIFILNYIPIIGGVLAVILPVLFAAVQFTSLIIIGALAGILFLVQFIINNTIQPKMMGDSMNLSALVVVLSLTLWGALWGGVGMFLSAPLTVIFMIIFAQFETTRWIAVLLSADGEPDLDPEDKKRLTAQPSL